MLDRYFIGDVQRISPEAPVPVVLLKNKNDRAGGAANVAANLAGLGIETRIVGCIGQDDEGEILTKLLIDLGIAPSGLIKSSQRPTIAKTRILGGHQQMMRLDQEDTRAYSKQEVGHLKDRIDLLLLDNPSIVILSDYAKGVLSEELCKNVIRHCRELKIPVLVDPKGRDYSKYLGATALTPNKRETADACGVSIHDNEALLSAASKMREDLELEFLAVTRGEEGISLLQKESRHQFNATAKQVFDVSGAGDTVIATLAAGIMSEMTVEQALILANIAAGIVVGKVGTAPIYKDELFSELSNQRHSVQADKICSLDILIERTEAWRRNKQKIVFTNGCFDLLHAGHVTYLEAAKKTGDRLILGLNTDRSVSSIKGPTRPIIHQDDRARVLAALESVDAVVLFDEDTPIDLIKAIRPDVIVKGSDYSEDQVVGGAEVKSWGGTIALIDVVEGRSTSNIINKLAN